MCAAFRAERIFVHFGGTGYSDGLVLFPLPVITQAIMGSRDGGPIVIQNDRPDFYRCS